MLQNLVVIIAVITIIALVIDSLKSRPEDNRPESRGIDHDPYDYTDHE